MTHTLSVSALAVATALSSVLAAYLKAETAQFAKLIRDAGIRAD